MYIVSQRNMIRGLLRFSGLNTSTSQKRQILLGFAQIKALSGNINESLPLLFPRFLVVFTSLHSIVSNLVFLLFVSTVFLLCHIFRFIMCQMFSKGSGLDCRQAGLAHGLFCYRAILLYHFQQVV